jgi:AraC-like DNA-binding protein
MCRSHHDIVERNSLKCILPRPQSGPIAPATDFHKHARKTFIDYVTELRIGRACGLLAGTDRTVADIAFATGFRNLSNFNRHFARLKHTTPRDYRKRTRAGARSGSGGTESTSRKAPRCRA